VALRSYISYTAQVILEKQRPCAPGAEDFVCGGIDFFFSNRCGIFLSRLPDTYTLVRITSTCTSWFNEPVKWWIRIRIWGVDVAIVIISILIWAVDIGVVMHDKNRVIIKSRVICFRM